MMQHAQQYQSTGVISSDPPSPPPFDFTIDFYAYWGLFQFCGDLSFHMTLNITDMPLIPLDLGLKKCVLIDQNCHSDLYSMIPSNFSIPDGSNSVVGVGSGPGLGGMDPATIAMLQSFPVLSNCDQWTAARAFAVLGALMAIITAIVTLLRTRPAYEDKIVLAAPCALAAVTAVFCLICMSLIVATEQNDSLFNLAASFVTITLSWSFVATVLAIAVSLFAAAALGYDIYMKVQAGYTNPWQIQASPETGILESHVSMYQEM